MKSVEQFFEDLFRGKGVNIRCIRGKKTIDFEKVLHDSDVKMKLKAKNAENYEIYFVVNSGGYRNEEIKVINAVFIDLDCGRNEEKEYYSLEETREYKNTKLNEISKFPLPPSYIVETRNGLHCYWLLEAGTTTEQFNECEEKLIAHFNADKNVKRLCNLMRLPDYHWCKDKDNKFEVKIVQHNEMRYNIKDIIDSCPEIPNKIIAEGVGGFRNNDKKKDSNIYDITVPKPREYTQANISSTTPNWKVIRYRNESIMKDRINAAHITLNNHDEVYDYIKRQDLAKFLDLSFPGNFSCIFHPDKNPSATIYTAENTEHQIYYCYSSSCPLRKHGKNIIQLTELLTNHSRYAALKFLRNVYNVAYRETEWQKEQKGMLEENQRLLMSLEFEESYEGVYKRIRDYLPELYSLNGIARDFIVTEAYTTPDGSPIFYASNQYLSSKFGKDVQAVSKRIALFTYLGLLSKLNDNEVPEFLIKRAKHEAAKKNQKQTIQFYSVPSYGELSMKYSQEKANEFVQKGFTMKGFGRELLLRTLGQEEAKRVYPKMDGKPLSEKSEQLSRLIEEFTLSTINSHGWTTEKEILENVWVKERKIKEREIKARLPELLEKYGLLKTRLNKSLKLTIGYKGDSKSYPYIIHKPELLEFDRDVAVECNKNKVFNVKRNVIFPKIVIGRKEKNTAG